MHYFCSTYNNAQQGSRGTESDTTEITHVGNLSPENQKDKYATKIMNDAQKVHVVNKYTVLTVGEVVVERSSESILGSSIFEGGEERLQFFWGV